MRLKHNRKIVLVMVFWIGVALPQTVLAANTGQDAGIREQILEGQLDNNEVHTIKRAVDRALEDVRALDYNFNVDEILKKAASGNPMDHMDGFPSALLGLLGRELKGNVFLMMELFAVMLLSALLKALQPRENGIPNETVKLAINGTMAVMVAASFGGVVQVAQGTIESMQTLASLVMPALFALLAASGQIVSATALQPLMLVGVNVACHVFKTILLPLAIMAGILYLVDSISDRFRLKNLAKLLKTIVIWITGAITLVFSLAVSLQRVSGGAVDAAAVKSAKFAIGTLVPVAGKNMSDAAETLLACTNAVRNAAGVVAVIGLSILFSIPFLKMLVIMLTYRLVAAFGAPLCDDNICDALENAAGCMSVMIGIMGASLFVLILLTGTLMSSTGSFL